MWSVDNGAEVINLSLSGTAEPARAAIDRQYALAAAVTVVAAAGNSSNNTAVAPEYPASLPGVIGVGHGRRQRGYALLNYGPDVALAAPGGRIHPEDHEHRL